jgi:manganese efflux pump family protein
MNIWIVLGMAIALAMDCFAVAMGASCGPVRLSGRQTLRMAFSFGAFQFAMPVLGWFAGENILPFIERFDHWAAFGLLAFVGGKMILESFGRNGEKGDGRPADRTRGGQLLVLSLATSIDALAVGLSLAMVRTGIFGPAAIIGATSFGLTVLGTKLGPLLGRVVGKRAELAGGLVLIAIGIKILTQHLK